jgi:hypothetical protein
MRNWLKTLLFISTFSPALLSVAVARIWDQGFTWDATYYGFAGFAGTLTLLYIIDALRWHGEAFPFTAKKIEANDALMLGIVATYFLPLFAKAADITIAIVFALLALVFAVLWFSSSIPPSPLLRVLGYRFYKAESSNGVVYTLITRRDLLDPREVKTVKKITASMLVEVT